MNMVAEFPVEKVVNSTSELKPNRGRLKLLVTSASYGERNLKLLRQAAQTEAVSLDIKLRPALGSAMPGMPFVIHAYVGTMASRHARPCRSALVQRPFADWRHATRRGSPRAATEGRSP